MSLGEPCLIRPKYHRQMSEAGHRISERLKDRHLSRRIGEVIISTYDMRYVHERIVHDDRKVIGGIAVGPQNDQIVQYIVLEHDLPLDEIIHHGLAFLGGFESQCSVTRRIGNPKVAAAAIVTR